MHVNVPMSGVDIVILVIIGIMMIGGVRIVRGFFHEGKHDFKQSTYSGNGELKMKIAIGGMQCGHCEANINDAIRDHFDIEKVVSNHTKGEAVVYAKHDIDEDTLKKVIQESGYQVLAVEKQNR